MPIFDAIKRLLGKEDEQKELQKEESSVNSLPQWLSKKSNNISNKIEVKLGPIKYRITNEIDLARDNLNKLASAELRNPNISLKELQFMKGNREAYMKRAGIFLDRLKLPETPKDILLFVKDFDKELDSFGKSIARPYHILQDFFGHESREVALNIKNIDSAVKELNALIICSGLDRVGKLESDINSLLSSINQKKELISSINSVEDGISALIKDKESSEQELRIITESKEFAGLQKLKEEKNKIIKEFNEHKKELIHSFAILERSLKKFHRIAFENQDLIGEYLDNPVGALEQDKELKILEILDKVRSSVGNDKLDLKDRKKDKTIEEIAKLTKEFFVSFKDKYDGIKSKLNSLSRSIDASDIEQHIEDINSKLEKAVMQIESKKRSLENSKEELKKINLEKTKSDIEKEAKHLNVDLKINIH